MRWNNTMQETMQNIDLVLKYLEPIIKAEDKELREALGTQYSKEEKDTLIGMSNSYEKKLRTFLSSYKKHHVKLVKQFVGKDAIDMSSLLAYMQEKINADPEDFEMRLKDLNINIKSDQIKKLTKYNMNIIDKDLSFNTLSPHANRHIHESGAELASLIKGNTDENMLNLISKGIEEGQGIDVIARGIEDSYGYSPSRARRIALTETLASNSVSQFEAYKQSPTVTGKKWKHSGGKGINVRPSHVAYSGTKVALDKMFEVNGEMGEYPRAMSFSAKNRVNCHCVMGPVTDPNIADLPPQERREMQQERIQAQRTTETGRDTFISKIRKGQEDGFAYEGDLADKAMWHFNERFGLGEAYEHAELVGKLRKGWMGSSTGFEGRAMMNYFNEKFNLGLKEQNTLEPLDEMGKRVVDWMKENTYKELLEAGITHVKVYRGVRWGEDQLPDYLPNSLEDFEVTGRALTSWTMDREVADRFGSGGKSGVFEAEVPIEQIFSTFDANNETEVVPIGPVRNARWAHLSEEAREQYKKQKGLEYVAKQFDKQEKVILPEDDWMQKTAKEKKKIDKEFDKIFKQLKKKSSK